MKKRDLKAQLVDAEQEVQRVATLLNYEEIAHRALQIEYESLAAKLMKASVNKPLETGRDRALKMLIRRAHAAEYERDRLLELLKRLRGWDMFDVVSDGPYWRREIDDVIGSEFAFSGEGKDF